MQSSAGAPAPHEAGEAGESRRPDAASERRDTPNDGAARDALRASDTLWAALALVPLLAFTWTGSLLASDEIVFALFAQSMHEGANLLDLTIGGEVFHQRPPLSTWLIALSTRVFGFGEFGLRLPGVLSGWAAVLLTADIARRLFGRAAMVPAGLFLLLTPLFFVTCRRPITDPQVVLFWVACLWAWVQQRGRPLDWALVGALVGLGMMTKQLVGAFPAAILLVDHIARWRAHPRPFAPVAIAAGTALAVAAPWHLAQSLRYGASFWSEFIGYIVVERVEDAQYGTGGATFYWDALRDQAPLLLAFGGAGAVLAASPVRPLGSDAAKLPAWRAGAFVWAWILVAFVPFQLSATKLDTYLLPLLPALALGAGALVAWVHRRTPRLSAPLSAMLGLVMLLGVAEDLSSPDYAPAEKELAGRLAPDAGDVVALQGYPQAFFWYADRPMRYWTGDANAYELMADSMLLRRLDAVALVPPSELFARLALLERPVHLVAPCRVRDDLVRAAPEAFAPGVQEFNGLCLFGVSSEALDRVAPPRDSR